MWKIIQWLRLFIQRRKHFINLFIWPLTRNSSTAEDFRTQQGYNVNPLVPRWLEYWAVSDVNQGDLREFVRLVRKGSTLRHRTNKARAEGVGKPRRNPRQQGTQGVLNVVCHDCPISSSARLSRQIQTSGRRDWLQVVRALPRGVKITAAGEFLLKEARRILQEANDATASAKRIASGQAGTFEDRFRREHILARESFRIRLRIFGKTNLDVDCI